ncbi:MAG: CehA/McbA family metallohydrolase [Armatimonadetes bacterium]|nr:CehA/McbA family metallohydrolase [Armatimonadota bacterium]
MTVPWSLEGQWLKGALHTHTTNSDGRLSAQEVAELYRRCGYDFVVFTDHGHVTRPEPSTESGLVVIEGVELSVRDASGYTSYHLVAIDLMPDALAQVDRSTPQAAVDSLRDLGALVYVAHPYWSALRDEHLLSLEGVAGLEVFNAGCEYETGHGDSSQHWDMVLARGKLWQAIAVDDAHNYEWDSCGGLTMVRAKERSREAILQALREGSFYASAGPVIENLALADGAIHIACSAAAAIHMIVPQPGRGWTTHQLCKRPPCHARFTELEIPVPPPGTVFRLEVVDHEGRKAWTNPFVLE